MLESKTWMKAQKQTQQTPRPALKEFPKSQAAVYNFAKQESSKRCNSSPTINATKYARKQETEKEQRS
jgi:hypothetical protein